jgi:taurine--2-oxoglutarate transaminase
MNGSDITKQQTTYVLQSWSKQGGLNPIPVTKAEGIYIYDADGKRYSDMSSQLVNLNLGHGNKEIAAAIKAQSDIYCYLAPSYASEARGTLAKMLIDKLPDNFGKIFFTNAGAEANENAVKIARMYTGRNKVFSRYRSYHGSSFGAGNLTGEPRRYPLEPGIPGFVKFFDPYVYRAPVRFATETEATEYYLSLLREQILYENPQNVAAIVMETVTGSNGIIIPPKGYLAGVRQLCDEFGILMILDEVMTGFGRTGKYFGFEHFAVKPDIVTFAKGVTCGYVPLGGAAAASKIAAYFDDNFLSCGLTYSGHPLGCAAGVAALNYYDEHQIPAKVAETGKVLGALLEEIKAKHRKVGDVRYIGLFAAVELVKDKETREALCPYGSDPEGVMKKVNGALAKRGFMTYTHENCVLIAPPLIITAEQLSEEMAKLDEALTELEM